MPAAVYLDQQINVWGIADFTGAVDSATVDFGDGETYTLNQGANAQCASPPKHQNLAAINGVHHYYAVPGTYTISATVTTADCIPSPTPPAAPPQLYAPNGDALPPPYTGPVGARTTLFVSLTVLVLPHG
jgi:hypothetical protein